MNRDIIKTFNVMSISMLCSFIGTIFLGNILSIEDFGFFNTVKTFLPMASLLILMGIDKSFIKNFSNQKEESIVFFLLISFALLSALISFMIELIFSLNNFLIIFITIFLGALNLFSAAYYRLNNSYMLAQFSQSGNKIVFLSIVFTLYYFNFEYNNIIVYFFLIPLFIPGLVFFKYIYDTYNKRLKKINFYDYISLYKYGFLFF